MPTRYQLEAAVTTACERLAEKDRPLFKRNVNERSLSHKFAIYLQQQVDAWTEGWDVDCEFNRDARDTGEDYVKQLDLINKFDSLTTNVHDEHAKTVFPDIIVHQRGFRNNLLVVEIKKNTATPASVAFDKQHKLQAYVHQMEYQAAVFVLLEMTNVSCSVEWIKHLG